MEDDIGSRRVSHLKKQDRSRRCKYIQSIDIENAEKTLACLTEYIYIALSDLVRFILGELR